VSKIILALYVLATSLGLIVLKYGTKSGLPVSYLNHRLQFNINAYTVAGLFLYGVSFLLYIYLISKNDLGYIIPLAAAFVYILIFAGSFIVFKESFTVAKVIGIGMIVGGLIFLNLGK
jgi:drug/metabolite transporter (DMT)-like permease